jgi:acetaldehyde dehydrogenase (acetylating)
MKSCNQQTSISLKKENTKPLKVAILGSGNIGTDLLIKVMRSPYLECTRFIGRNLNSPGMNKASSLGVTISDLGINEITKNPNCCDLVFDATSALDHQYHWSLLKVMGKIVVDMTPSRVGEMSIPAINLYECLNFQNVNMVTCGGQASIPMAHCIGQVHHRVDYIEVISSIASKSAGPATRLNIDEYVETTEKGIKTFSRCHNSKAMLILNPAQPSVNMQTTIFARVQKPDLIALTEKIMKMVEKIRSYVPGYELIVPPAFVNDRIVIMVRVQGLGDYLPKYSGNLDIINCAAIAMAEEYSKRPKQTVSCPQET